jgi:phosphatidylglycerophosphate synthase
MTVAAQAELFRRSRKVRPITELVCEGIFRPLAHLLVLVLLPLRVPPPAVVLTATTVGAAAAYSVDRGHLVVAALLLQLKTVLDNADGQLARASGRASVLGRYLDSESDLLVDALLFAALGHLTGRPLLAGLAFAALTLVLGVDFNLERLYRRERGDERDPMPHAAGRTKILERIYGVVYAPQDRIVEGFTERRLARLGADEQTRLAYHDRATVAVVANFGLTTQLAAIGICLGLGSPDAAFWPAIGCAVALVPLAIRRELVARSARRLTTTGR